jgi:hypothetical protein
MSEPTNDAAATLEREQRETERIAAARHQINRALGGLRYGGLVHAAMPDGLPGYGKPESVGEAEYLEAVANWLVAFSETIAHYADEATRNASKLSGVQHDIAAMRRVLGTNPDAD